MFGHERFKIEAPADLATIEATPVDTRLPYRNTYEMFRDAATAHQDKLALRFLPTGSVGDASVDFTYAEFLSRITQAANLFHTQGIRPGTVVAYLLPNLPEAYFCLWGGEAAGIVCAINYFLEPAHIGALLDHANAEVLVIEGLSAFPIWEKLTAIRSAAPKLRTVLRVGDGPDQDDDGGPVLDFATELAAQPGDRLISQRAFDQQDVAAYFHTGGTTGVPKITPLTHRNEMAATWSCLQMFGITADEVLFCAMPLFHAGGIKVGGMFPFAAGATVVLAGAAGFRNPAVISEFWHLTERFGVTYAMAPPTVWGGLLQVPIDADVSTLEFLQVSAAPSPPELFRRFEAATGLPLHEAYGLTEATLVTNANPRGLPPRPGSTGFRVPYVEQKVVALDGQGAFVRDCAAGEIGVIAARGPTVFPGYLPPASQEGLWLGDGWLNTGDMGRLDADGYLWITGRQKDMIIRSGHNIDPETIEAPMHEHPAVALCAAVGKPDAYAGELPVAFVKLVDGGHATVDALMAYAKDKIPERAAVPKEIWILEDLPLTAVGKIAKNTLRNRIAETALNDALSEDPEVSDAVRLEIAVDPVKGAMAVATLRSNGVGEERLRSLVEEILGRFTVPYRIEMQRT